MAASFAKHAVHAFNREKPRSSITEWIEILTSPKYEQEAYDGIPELVDSINLQAEGTAEASRAIRKKLKHGNAHQQVRALVILKALVENCGPNFQTSFANDRLTDAIRQLSSDPGTDSNVKKKLLVVLASWKRQFQGDPKMMLVASLYDQCRPLQRRSVDYGLSAEEAERRKEKEREKEAQKREKEEAKLRAKQQKEEERERARRPKRKPFNIAQERPQILSSIASASQASSNLVNALMLVNQEQEPIQANIRVQECLSKAKSARKQVVRYIQLVEDEELIGTLLETNERVIHALEMYDKYLIPDTNTETGVEDQLARTTLGEGNGSVSELNKLQEKQRAAVARSVNRGTTSRNTTNTNVYSDLHDLDFGALGSDAAGLPPPIRPSDPDSPLDERGRGSLSDFSDYDSSDQETHNRRSSGSRSPAAKGKGHVAYRSFSDEDLTGEEVVGRQGLLEEDPFADPDVGAPGIAAKHVGW